MILDTELTLHADPPLKWNSCLTSVHMCSKIRKNGEKILQTLINLFLRIWHKQIVAFCPVIHPMPNYLVTIGLFSFVFFFALFFFCFVFGNQCFSESAFLPFWCKKGLVTYQFSLILILSWTDALSECVRSMLLYIDIASMKYIY